MINFCFTVRSKICPFAKLGFEGVNICKKPRLFSKNWFRSGRGRRLRRPVIKTDSDHNKCNEDINRIRIRNSNRYVFSGRRGRRPLPTYPYFILLNKNLSYSSGKINAADLRKIHAHFSLKFQTNPCNFWVKRGIMETLKHF